MNQGSGTSPQPSLAEFVGLLASGVTIIAAINDPNPFVRWPSMLVCLASLYLIRRSLMMRVDQIRGWAKTHPRLALLVALLAFVSVSLIGWLQRPALIASQPGPQSTAQVVPSQTPPSPTVATSTSEVVSLLALYGINDPFVWNEGNEEGVNDSYDERVGTDVLYGMSYRFANESATVGLEAGFKQTADLTEFAALQIRVGFEGNSECWFYLKEATPDGSDPPITPDGVELGLDKRYGDGRAIFVAEDANVQTVIIPLGSPTFQATPLDRIGSFGLRVERRYAPPEGRCWFIDDITLLRTLPAAP